MDTSTSSSPEITLESLAARLSKIEIAFTPISISFQWKNPNYSFLVLTGLNSDGIKIPLISLRNSLFATVRDIDDNILDKLELSVSDGELGFDVSLDTGSISPDVVVVEESGSSTIKWDPSNRIPIPYVDRLSHRLSCYSGPETDFSGDIVDPRTRFSCSHIIHTGPIAWGLCTLRGDISRGMIATLNFTTNLAQRRYIRAGVCTPNANLDLQMYGIGLHWFWFGYSGLFYYPDTTGKEGFVSKAFESSSYVSNVSIVIDRTRKLDRISVKVGETPFKSVDIDSPMKPFPEVVRLFIGTFDPLDTFNIQSFLVQEADVESPKGGVAPESKSRKLLHFFE